VEHITHRIADAIGALRATASPEAQPIVTWLHEFAINHPWWTLAIAAWLAWEFMAWTIYGLRNDGRTGGHDGSDAGSPTKRPRSAYATTERALTKDQRI
jgi:hypothetical protein